MSLPEADQVVPLEDPWSVPGGGRREDLIGSIRERGGQERCFCIFLGKITLILLPILIAFNFFRFIKR